MKKIKKQELKLKMKLFEKFQIPKTLKCIIFYFPTYVIIFKINLFSFYFIN